MHRLIIAVEGDNEHLHREALKAAVQAVEDVNPTNSVYRAYLEKIEDGEIVAVPNAHADVSDRSERQLAHATGTPHHTATKRVPPQPDLSDYKVTFRRNPLFRTWMWEATTPDGTVLTGFGFGYADKGKAEHDAAQRIALHAERETVSGETLRQRLNP